MSSRPYWASILQWTLWFALMAGIYHVLDRARMKSAKSGDDTVMTYPRSAVVLSVIFLLLFAALTALIFFAPAGNSTGWAKVILALLLLATLHMTVDCFIGRYTLSDEGLRYVNVFSGERMFRWDELSSLKYAPHMRWFVLTSSQGHVARISVMMTGLPAFARLLMERARNVSIDPATIPILKQTARGELPSMWNW
jgi:hypothetical protein